MARGNSDEPSPMAPGPGPLALVDLPSELLVKIVEYSSQSRTQLLELWRERMSLSMESFAAAPEHDFGHIGQIGREIQFTRIQIRFSPEGFHRAQFEEILRDLDQLPQSTSISHESQPRPDSHQSRIAAHYRGQVLKAMTKADDQRRIIRESVDQNALLRAFTEFKNLKQIRIMRVMDEIDRGWAMFLRNNPSYADARTASEWSAASEHTISTVYTAAERSASPFNRLSSRFMDPSTPLVITLPLKRQIESVARKLESIELQLIDHPDPDEEITGLSPMFDALFRAAVGLHSFHIGSSHRISVPLETVFHGLHFKNLKHIGLHLWLLDSEELLGLLARHQRTLRSLRLRRISLRRAYEGDPTWQRVLRYIRSQLKLSWISLRMISYEGEENQTGGMHPMAPLPHQHDNDSESDIEDPNDWSDSQIEDEVEEQEEEEEDSEEDGGNGGGTMMAQDISSAHHLADNEASVEGLGVYDTSVGEPEEDEDHHSDLDEIHGEFEVDHTQSSCHCHSGFAWDDLGDDRVSISKQQWKRWERWSIYRCEVHDPHQ
ncbi:hypothetical protein QTJ16_006903 [Diplocarpon rosae]|uniref:Uncharacterized protein n=1 Tax=Diplocarpon rosae TaxID=946125 RepID=A0AAD9SVG5_9HELO|nr:hypothetical protein QTJ16_006903 [Diplocarpon rosae]